MYNSIYASPITIPYSPTFTPAPNTPYVKNNNIYLSWVPPVNDGGSPILYYKI